MAIAVIFIMTSISSALPRKWTFS